MSELMNANRDSSVQIKVSDRFAYHVRLERRSVKPGNEQYPEVSHHIKCYTIKVYEHLEALRTAPNPIDWVRAGGFVSAFVVHNPHLEKQNEPEQVEVTGTTNTGASDARKEKQRERMRIANATRAAKKAADNAK